MNHENAIEIVGPKPAIFKLLPEDRFFKRAADIHELVARRAYELAMERGFASGHELEDWLHAEPQVVDSIPSEVSETSKAITLKAVLPGYRAKDIEIHVEPKHLFITGHHQERSEENKGNTSSSALCSKQLFHSVELATEIDPEKVSATLNNGELQIDLPKSKIELKTTAKGKVAA